MPLGSSHGGDCGSREWTDGYDDVDISGPPPLYRDWSVGLLGRARGYRDALEVLCWCILVASSPYVTLGPRRENRHLATFASGLECRAPGPACTPGSPQGVYSTTRRRDSPPRTLTGVRWCAKRAKNAQKSRKSARSRRLNRRPAASRGAPRALRSLQRVKSRTQRRQVPILHARGERAGEQMSGWSWEGGWGRSG